VRANPALSAAFFWPLLTLFLTGVFGPHSEAQLAKYPSWIGSALRFCGALGIDVPKLVAVLKGDSK
jgi:hypothetical protein